LSLLAKKPEYIEEQKEKELTNSMTSNNADKTKSNVDDTVVVGVIESTDSDLIDPQFSMLKKKSKHISFLEIYSKLKLNK